MSGSLLVLEAARFALGESRTRRTWIFAKSMYDVKIVRHATAAQALAKLQTVNPCLRNSDCYALHVLNYIIDSRDTSIMPESQSQESNTNATRRVAPSDVYREKHSLQLVLGLLAHLFAQIRAALILLRRVRGNALTLKRMKPSDVHRENPSLQVVLGILHISSLRAILAASLNGCAIVIRNSYRSTHTLTVFYFCKMRQAIAVHGAPHVSQHH